VFQLQLSDDSQLLAPLKIDNAEQGRGRRTTTKKQTNEKTKSFSLSRHHHTTRIDMEDGACKAAQIWEALGV
jgi:transglutaminase/protease-like cytokinesis protein 3